MPRVCIAIAALGIALAGAVPAGAQQLRGRLLDLDTEQPIAGGLVTLMSERGGAIATSFTDDSGHWQFQARGAGRFLIAARRIGYQPWTAGPVEVKAGDDLQFVFRLRPLARLLPTTEIVARATRRHLELVGFYDRQRADFGHFLTPEAIERRGAARITDLLIGLPGVRTVSTSEGSAGGKQIQLRAGNLSPGGMCRPRVFVDGVMFARGDARRPRDNDARAQTMEQFVEDELLRLDKGLSLDDIGPPSIIAAIEIYRTATQVPVQFGGASIETSCGVIVVWTRRGIAKTSP